VERAPPSSDGCRQPGRLRTRLPTPDAGRGGLGGRGTPRERTNLNVQRMPDLSVRDPA